MASNMNLEMTVSLNDEVSSGLQQVAAEVERNAQRNVQSVQRSEREIQQASQRTGDVRRELNQRAEQYSRRLAQVREQFGVRSEHQIRREIQRTEAAYNRLARSGTASANELSRAFEAQRRQVAALNAEMGRVSMGDRLGNLGRGMAGVAAGVTAGYMVMREPSRKEMSYDRQLAMVANTAFSDRDVSGRIAGKQELHKAIKNAVEIGGGSKEDAMATLDTLLASGAVSAETAMNLLPTLQKGAVATGASSQDLAAIAISSMQQFGIDEKDIGKVLDMAVAAGQAGNFELADMARWLPQQMAAAKSAGLSGLEGLSSLLVANQQARVTAGTSDEAGNNLVNLLAKITAKETSERFKNIEYTDARGKKYGGINLIKSMENYKAQGQDSLQAFMSIMDDVIGSDANYRELQEKLKTANTEERKALLEQMTNLVEGTAIGKVISDRQALMALLGIRNNVQLGEEVRRDVANSAGAVETSHQVIKSTNDYKKDDLKNTAEFAQMESMKGFNNVVGSVSETLSDYAKQYPTLTTALAGGATAVGALAAAAFSAAGSLALLGGKGGLGGLAKTTLGSGAVRTTASTQAARGGLLGGSLAPVGVGLAALLYSQELNGGEDEVLALQHKIRSGKASASEMAMGDMLYAKNRGEVDERLRKLQSDEYKQNRSFTPEQQAEYDSAVEEIKRQLDQKQYAESVKTLDGWFVSDEKKANALGVLKGLDPSGLSVEQRADVTNRLAEQREKERRQAVGVIQNLYATPQQKDEAKAFLDKLKQEDQMQSGESLAQFDFSPFVQGQEQTFGQFQSSLTADLVDLGDKLSSAIQAQTATIQNTITVELEGRVLAEQMAEYQYQSFKRG